MWHSAFGILCLTLLSVVDGQLPPYDPTPNPLAVITCGKARFTVLSTNFVRCEFSSAGPTNEGDDRATGSIINRRLPLVNFTVARNTNGSTASVQIETSDLTLQYTDFFNMKSFQKQNLNIFVKATSLRWYPGTPESRNLNGTYAALDVYSNPMAANEGYWTNGTVPWNSGMALGLVSRDGWHVHNDTLTFRLTPVNPKDPILPFWITKFPKHYEDLYFMSHGVGVSKDGKTSGYEEAVRQWALVSGTPSRVDRSMLGIWNSRYYPYSATSILDEVIAGFATHEVPLHVVVLDMDWHIEPTEKNCNSWGAWDFNTTLFPDPQGFITSLHTGMKLPDGTTAAPLRLSLNMHPQTGVDPCASKYHQFCSVLNYPYCPGNHTILSDMTNETFVSAMEDLYLDADPLRGVDYWWTDYGGTGEPTTSVNTPLFWSNLLWGGHRGMVKNGNRSFVLARYGSDPLVSGLGNHRIPALFTGDTFEHEATLAYQVTTAGSAANFLVSYVSHDIGGNHLGAGCEVGTGDPTNFTSSELLLRWVQFGVMSSWFRTHCDHCERRPWMFPFHADALMDAYRLRGALLPMFYTHSVEATQTGVSAVTPMYWEAPDQEAAYDVPLYQYMLLRNILVAPIVTFLPANASHDSFLKHTVWIPPGQWSRWDGSEVITGPLYDTQGYNTSMMPLFVRAGSLLPLQKTDRGNQISRHRNWCGICFLLRRVATSTVTLDLVRRATPKYLRMPTRCSSPLRQCRQPKQRIHWCSPQKHQSSCN